MALYNSRGNMNVSTDSGWGLFTTDGELRVTIVSGTTRTGLYAANGGYNVVITQATDSYTGLYHPCGALRVVESTSNTGIYAPNGAFFVSGAAYSAYILGSDTDGLALASRDDTMTIRSTSDTNDNYQGTPGAKLTTTRASTASYWDINGVLQYAATGTLRRDFDPRLASTVERCGYLIEEARTNLALRSEDFTNAAWINISTTDAADASTDPTGATGMDRITASAASSGHYIYQGVTTSAVVYTFSVFLKYTNNRWVALRLFDGTTSVFASFDLLNGATGAVSGATSAIVNCGGGIYRCSLTTNSAVAASASSNFLVAMNNVDSASIVTWTPAGTETVDVWGAQLEAGSFASSYIPTAGATVTRAADLITLAGTLFPLNQTEGTLYAKWAHAGTGANHQYALVLDDGTANESVFIWRASNSFKPTFGITDGGASQVNLVSTGTISTLTQIKSAAAYKLNDSAVAQAGETVQMDNVCTMPTTTQLALGNRADGLRALNGWLFEAAYFPTRKTNSQLQALASGYASDALLLMGAETQGLTFAATDQSMSILDTGTPANAYSGELSAKLGSIRTSAGMTYLSSGLLGWGPENLLLRSQEFDNVYWTKGNTTVSADAVVAPDGTLTADKLVEDSNTSTHTVYRSIVSPSPDTVHTWSIYAKAAERSWLRMHLTAGAGTGAYFNLVTGVVGTVEAGYSASITAVGDGWYRCSIKMNTPATFNFAIAGTTTADNTASYLGDGVSGIYIWGAQLERAASASTYKPTTSAAYYGLRLDYDTRLTGGPGYLVEEARTNLALQSQTLGTTWSVTRATVSADATTAPDGTTTADKIVEDSTAANTHVISQIVTYTATTWTYSVYLKAAGRTWARLAIFDGTTAYAGYYNLSSGVVGTFSNATGTIQSVGNGWYRCTVTTNAATAAAAGTIGINISEADNDSTFDGNGTDGIYAWGAQLEAGAFATSYIPTTSATVTRAADDPVQAGTTFPLSQTEGTLVSRFAFMDTSAAISVVLNLDDDGNNERHYIGRNTDRTAIAETYDGGVAQMSKSSTATIANQTLSGSAYAYKANDCAVVQAGESVSTDASATMPTTTQLVYGNRGTGGRALNGWLRHGRYYPRRATNTELATLAAAA